MYSNFVKHLQRIHRSDYEQVFGKNAPSPNANSVTDDQSAVELTKINKKQNEFGLLVTKNLIIQCNLPLNTVEQPGFRRFLKDCNLKLEPISSKRIKHVIIPSVKIDLVNKIHHALNGVDALSVTVDAWSNKCLSIFFRLHMAFS